MPDSSAAADPRPAAPPPPAGGRALAAGGAAAGTAVAAALGALTASGAGVRAGPVALAGGVAAFAAAGVALAVQARAHGRALAAAAERAQADAQQALLRESDARFRQLVEQSPEAILVHDARQVHYANPACLRLFGAASLREMPGHALAPYVHPDDRALVAERLVRLAGDAAAAGTEFRVVASDGRERMVAATSVPVTHAGAPAVQTVLRDVTERRQLETQLTQRAFHDALTGLANRALFRDRTAHALARLARGAGGREPGERVAALLIDLDHFKHVNDSLGHAAGDLLLAEVASRLLGATRGCDTVARLGGDEFGVLLERMQHDVAAERVADRVLAALRSPFVVNGREVSVGASVGIAFADDAPPADGRDGRGAGAGERDAGAAAADALLRNADLALYAAKGQGRFRHATFAPAMHADALARLELEGELRAAVAALGAPGGPGVPPSGGFVLAYQPIVDLDGDGAPAFEALLRWHPAGRPPVPPLQVVPLAEETGLIVPLGRWVLGEACRQLAAWDASGAGGPGARLQVSVNVSGRQLQDPALVADVEAALAAAGVAPGRLVVEITESVMMHDPAATRATLAALRALGVRVAIDDFGTGYSSLAYLRQFPVDVLKIDKTFVDGVGRGGDESVLATAIVTLGRALALTTVAEGIEEAAQLARLRELGCARGQGYLFARPLAAADVPRWLGEWAARRAAEEAVERAAEQAAPADGAPADGALAAADPLTPTRA